MRNEVSDQKSLLPKASRASTFYVLGSIALVTTGLIYFDNIFKPFILALLLWFIIYQIKLTTDRIKIRGRSIPSIASGILAFLLIFIVIFIIVEVVIINVEDILVQMPQYIANFNQSYDGVESVVNNPQILEYVQSKANNLDMTAQLQHLANSFADGITRLGIVIVFVFFLLLERATYSDKLKLFFPEKNTEYHRFYNTINRIGRSVRSYVWAKTVISFLTGAVSWAVLVIMGVDHAFLWSVLIFLLNFVPYIGPLISSLLPALYAGLVMGDLMKIVYVFVAMEAVQFVLATFIEPRVLGKGANLSPVVVFLALMFWSTIWGAYGMILAVPVTSLIVIVCSQLPSTRFVAVLMSEKGEIPNIA